MEHTAPSRMKQNKPVLPVLLGVALAAYVGFAGYYNAADRSPAEEVPPAASVQEIPEAPAVETAGVSAVPGLSPSAAAANGAATEEPPAPYDFAQPAPEGEAVDKSYFADAAFVGDSRTEGFWLYSGVKQGKLLCATGLTVFSVDSKIMTGGSQTVLDALCSGSFDKIYLGFGLNELGYIDRDSFVETYRQLIGTIRRTHPNAIIYIQNLIPVNDGKARASGHKGHVNCDRIRLYNELIAQIAREEELPLLDLYSAFAVDGQLPAEASRDGVHPLPAYYKKQLDYLLTHTVAREQPADPPVEPSADAPAPEVFPETEVTEL